MRFSDLYADARDVTEKVDLLARALDLVLTEDQVAELGPAQLEGTSGSTGQLLDNNVAGYASDPDLVRDTSQLAGTTQVVADQPEPVVEETPAPEPVQL